MPRAHSLLLQISQPVGDVHWWPHLAQSEPLRVPALATRVLEHLHEVVIGRSRIPPGLDRPNRRSGTQFLECVETGCQIVRPFDYQVVFESAGAHEDAVRARLTSFTKQFEQRTASSDRKSTRLNSSHITISY